MKHYGMSAVGFFHKCVVWGSAWALTASAAWAATAVSVNATYNEQTPGWGTTAFATIQSAVSAVEAGGTVTVEAGTYNENVNITKRLTLVSSSGKEQTFVRGSAAQSVARAGGNLGTICVFSSNVSIGTGPSDGFTVVGYDWTAPGLEHSAVYLKAAADTGLRIVGNRIIADGESALLAEYSHPVGSCEIAYNVIEGKSYVGDSVGGNSSVQYSVPNVPRSLVYISGNAKNVAFHHNAVSGSVGGLIAGSNPAAYYYNTGVTIDCKGATSLSEGAVITDNTFAVGSWAALRARGYFTTSSGNTFDSRNTGCDQLCLAYYEQTATAQLAGDTFLLSSGDNLAAVVAGSKDSDIIQLEDGVYDGNVTITKSITLSGAGANTILNGTLTLDAADIAVNALTLADGKQWVVTENASIESAVTAATSGDVITIRTGSYTGNVEATEKALTLAIGASPGQVTLDGDLVLTADDQLEIELNGTDPGSATGFDQWVVNGTVTLGGATLAGSLGFTPAVGTAFTILANDGTDAVGGTFADLGEGAAFELGGVTFSITYAGGDGNDVVLTVAEPATVFVDDDFTAEAYSEGVWGYSAFAAVQDGVNVVAEGGVVLVAAGTYNESVYIAKSLDVIGAGAASTILDGAGTGYSVITVNGSSDVWLEGITVQNGVADDGAGIHAGSARSLVVEKCVIKNNIASFQGGGLYAAAATRLVDSTLSGNSVPLTGSLRYGGGIFADGSHLELVNVTLSGNSGRRGGGLYLSESDAVLAHVTVTANTASTGTGAGGGGMYLLSGSQELVNTLVAGNTAGGVANDIVESGNSRSNAGVLIGENPLLGGLADNGGPTPTHALLAGSPALNSGVVCDVAADQRGVPRPQGSATDIGAFETVYTAYVDGAYTAEACGGHVWGQDAFPAVQAAINAVAEGGTVHVAAGTFSEMISVNKRVSVIGAGSGTDGTLLTAASGDVALGVVNLTASGLSDVAPVLLQNLRISAVARAGLSVGRFYQATGTTVQYVKLDNVKVFGTNTSPSTEQERGLYVDLTSTLKHLAVTGCAFDNLTYGWYFQKQVSADASTVQYVTVTDTSFSHNNHKGVYAEKLSDATFSQCTVAGNGFDGSVLPSYFAPYMCGIDLNLKAGTYGNLVFSGCLVDENALGGAKEGVGITVKARDDASSYNTYPAACAGVLITGCTITGNERGIRIGEPGKNNAGPTDVVIENNIVADNEKRYAGSDGSAYGGLINMSQAAVAADDNYWGDASGPAGSGDDVVAAGTGPVTYIPYFTETAKQNHAPYELTLSATTLAENAPAGTEIGTFSTTDVDGGDTFTYELVAGDGADDNASFVIAGGALKTAAAFDFEAKSSFSIRVRTTDSHVNNAGVFEKTFVVTVTDVEEAPVLDPVGNQATDEDVPLAFTATASDSDGDPLTFTWEGVPAGATATAAGAFSWTPAQSDIGEYTLTVTVSDGTGLSDSESFTVTVRSVNDNPTVASALPDLNKQQDFGTVTIDLAPVFADAESDALAYTVEVAGDPVLLATVEGAQLTLASVGLARGAATVTVTATESAKEPPLHVSDSFTVSVKPVWNTTRNTFFDTIQAAIADAGTVANDVITVAAGSYAGSVTLSKGVALRSVAGAAVTTLTGSTAEAVTVTANGAEVSGFTITNPNGLRGVYAKDYSHLTVKDNVIEQIATSVAVPANVVCGIMIYCSSVAVDDVVIQNNVIRYIQSKGNKKSANGIWVGDSAGNFDITGLLVQGNQISHVLAPTAAWDVGRGAYGVIINHASHKNASNMGSTVAPQILDNTITDLEGLWAHAIGLEGCTPNALVRGNTIARVIDHKSPADPDAVGVMVEDNASAATVTITQNGFSDVLLGVRNATPNPVVADGNYWGVEVPQIDEQVRGAVTVDNYYADATLTQLRYWTVYVDDSFPAEDANHVRTIQGGVNAVATYGNVYVAPGTYNERVVVGKTLRLAGENASATTVNGGGSGVVVTITADGVEMSGFTVTGSGMAGVAGGVGLVGVEGCTLTNIVAQGNLIGIGVVGGSRNAIVGNTLLSNGLGITLENMAAVGGSVEAGAVSNRIANNVVQGSLQHGINIPQNCDYNTVEGNTVTGCAETGIYLWKAFGCAVTGNTVNNNAVGIQDFASANATFTGNAVTANGSGFLVRTGVYGALEPAATNVLIAGNTIAGNTAFGLNATNNQGHVVFASGNFWGAPTGPSGAGFFGAGDAIAGTVSIESYYMDDALASIHYFDLYVDDSYAAGDLNVNHFLAVPDAYAAANPGDTIHVSDGAYTLPTTLGIAKPGLTLTGASRAGVTLDASARTSTAYGIHVSASDVTLEHFTLIPAAYAGAGFPIHVSAAPAILANVTLRDIAISGSFRTPFDANGVDNLTLDGLVASGAQAGSGIGLSGCVGVTITGCATAGNAWGGVRVSASPDVSRPSSAVAVNFTANVFGEVNALYVEGTQNTVLASGYSYRIESAAGAAYLEEGVTEAQAVAIALQGQLLTGLEVTGLFAFATGTYVPFGADLSTAEVYVDDDWSAATPGMGIPKPGAAAGTYLQFGRNAFATVQAGVGGVDAGGIVHVANGLYKESNTTLSRPVTIRGESRTGVVLAPAAEDGNLAGRWSGVYQQGFIVQTGGVHLADMTIDGRANAALTEGKHNFRVGIATDDRITTLNLAGLELVNLEIRNTYFYGVSARNAGTGFLLSGCHIADVAFGGYPSYGALSFMSGQFLSNTVENAGYRSIGVYNVDARIVSNIVVTATPGDAQYGSEGIYVYNYEKPNAEIEVSANCIVMASTIAGAALNLVGLSDQTVIGGVEAGAGNVIDLSDNGNADIGILNWYNRGQPVFQGNLVVAHGKDSGAMLFHNETAAAQPWLIDNRFEASNSDGGNPSQGTGVFVTDDGTFQGDENGVAYATLMGNNISGFARGVDLYQNASSPVGGRLVQVTISDDNSITGTAGSTGIRVHETDPTGARAVAVITGNAASITGCATGVDVDGGSAAISSNALCANAVAVRVRRSGTLTAFEHNVFEGGGQADNETDLLVEATAGNVAVGSGNAFAGDTFFIDNQAAQPFELFANDSSFDAVDNYAIEDRMFHKVDDLSRGLVRWVAGQIYITAPAVGSTDSQIQRGVDAAEAGDVVHVAAGTYEATTVTKSVNLLGANAGIAGYALRTGETVILNGGFTVSGADLAVVIDGFRFTGSGYTLLYGAQPSSTDILFRNNLVDSAGPVYSEGTTNWRDVSFIANKFVNMPGNALVLSNVGALEVIDNEFTGIGYNAVQLTGAAGITILSNRIDTTVAEAIKLGGPIGGGTCSFNTILNANTSLDGDRGGIRIRGVALPYAVTITGNVLSNCFNGVCVKDGEQLAGAAILIAGNYLAGNSNAGIYNGGTGTLIAENNWWGSETGPANAANPGATGSAAVGAMDFSPWLGSGTDTDPDVVGFQADMTQLVHIPAKLAFTTQPGGAVLGALLAPQPVVEVRDEFDHPTPWATHAVALAIAANPFGGGVLVGTSPLTATAGVVQFGDVAITVEGGSGYTLVASAPNLESATSEPFNVENPQPVLQSLAPIFKTVSSGGFTLTLNGQNFVPSSKVLWGAVEKTPATFSAAQLTVAISSDDITAVGPVPVTVVSPAPTGGTSATLTFTVTASAQAPVVYVDDDWTGYGNCGGHVWGYDAFKMIQDGVNAVVVGGTVNVAAGTYNEDVLLNKTVSVLGAGAGASVVYGPIGGEGATFRIAALGVVLDGFTITRVGNNSTDWNNSSLNSAGVAIQGQSVRGTVRNCVITGNRTGVDINNSNGNVLMNNAITFNRTGLIMRNQTDNLTIIGNEITDNWTVGVLFLDASSGSNSPVQTAANCTFNNNTISGNWYGDICDRQAGGSLLAPGSNLKNFSGNWFGKAAPVVSTANSAEPGYSSQIPVAFGGSAVNPGGAPNILGAASANIDYTPWLNVGTDTDNGAIGFKGDFASLWVDDDSAQAGATGRVQEAVNMVTSGGTVNVLAGTYREKVTLTKAVTVTGDRGDIAVAGPGANAPVLDGDLNNDGTPDKGDGFTIPCNTSLSGITVEGFIIQNFGNGGGGNGVGCGVISWENTSSNVTIRDNRFVNNGYNGVYVGTDSDDMQSHWLIAFNQVVGAPYAAIELTDVTDSQVLDNEISAPSVIFNDPGDAGVGIEIAARARAGTVTTSNIDVKRNVITGAFVAGSRAGINLLARAYDSGSADARLSGIAVEANVVTGCGTRAIDIVAESRNGKPSLIENLAITHNALGGNQIGIDVGDAFAAPKSNGTLSGSTITISNNSLASNALAGLRNLSGAAIVAENNWWGSQKGPTHARNAGGDGTMVSDGVDFSPWLGDGTDMQDTVIGFQPNAEPVYYSPKYLVFSAEPAHTTLSAQLAPQPVVTVMGENDAPAVQFSGVVTLSLGSNPGMGALAGNTNVACLSGVATFTNLAVTVGGGSGLTLAAASASPIEGATSAAFDVANPAPTAASLSPYWTHAGSGMVTVTITGSAFVPTSAARWDRAGNVTLLQTAYVSDTQLTAVVPAALVETAGTADISVATPGAGGGESARLQFRIEAAQPSVVYVDDDYASLDNDALVAHDKLPGWLAIKGYDAFATIQEALDAVAVGGTVHVAAGDYVEDLTADKPVQLLGPNAEISPNGGSREDEAIVYPATSAPDPNTTGKQILYVATSGVVVKGFLFNGDNPGLTSGILVKGADVDACEGIASYEGVGNVTVENNVIRNISYAAIDLYNWVNKNATSGNAVRGNRIENVGYIPYGFGLGVLLYNNCYAVVENNVMADVRVGVQTGNFHQPDPGDAHAIRNNSIAASRRGVFHNLQYSAATDFVISGNTFTAVDEPGASRWDGVLLSSLQGSVGALLEDNTVAVAGPVSQLTVGYHAWNTPTTGSVILRGGSVSDAQVGVWANNFDGYSSNGGATHLTVEDVAISGASLAGVYVKDNTNSTRSAVQVLLAGDTRISGCADGVLVQGENASVSFTGAAISSAARYVALTGNATNDVDATAVVFDGQAGAEMSLQDLLAAEDKITHQLDDASLGFVRVKAGEVFVTQASGSVQRGVNAASAGDTVHVAAGTFVEQVEIDSDITLLGAGAATIIQSPAVMTLSYTTSAANKPVLHVHDTASVAVRDLTVDGAGRGNANYRFMGVSYYRAGGLISNVVVTGVRDTPFSGAQHGNAIYAYADAAPARSLDVVGCQVSDFQKNGITMNGAFLTANVIGNRVTGAGATSITAQNGIQFGFGSTGSIRDNEVSGGDYTGSGWSAAGVLVYQSGVTLTGNKVSACECAINVTGPLSSMGAISHNDLSGNEWGLWTDAGAALAATSNWWGTANGPLNGTNAGGEGSAVGGAVDFSPWLASGADTDGAIGFQPSVAAVHYLPAGLVFTVQPGSAVLGAALSVQPVVTVTNEIGEVATQFNGAVTLGIGLPNPGAPVAGVLNGGNIVAVTNGVATFGGLSITQGSGNGYALVASAAAPIMAATSGAFGIANNVPQLALIGNQSVDEEVELSFTASATDLDAPPQGLVFSLVGAPAGAQITDGGVFTWTPTEAQGGADYTFTVVVTDNGGPAAQTASETLTVTVREVNVAPVLDAVGNKSVDEEKSLTFTATASDHDLAPAQTLRFSLAGAPAGAAIDPVTGVFTWTPSEAQGGSSYTFDVVVTDDGVNADSLFDSETITVTVAEVNVAPVLGVIPAQSVNFGQTLAFKATATDQDDPAQALTYSLTGAPAGAAIDPVTGDFTWTPTEAQAKGNYSFTVTVTDDGSNEDDLSDSQTVTVGAVSAAHSCPGYRSPSTTLAMVVSNRFEFAGTPEGLTWTPVLPNENWVITAADAGGNGVAEVQGGAVVFTTLPTASPAVFTYTVSVPGDQAVSNSLSAAVSFNNLTADVAPIAIFRYHSADYRRDPSGEFAGQFRRIDSTEVNRVLAYWRFGYKPDAAGYDGFVAVSGYTGLEAVHHSADTDKNWRISTVELMKVQGYWRANGYHIDLASADGYANNRVGTGPSYFKTLLGFPKATLEVPSAYNPGESLQVTCTFDPAGTAPLALGWTPSLPEGWVIESVSGDGAPELANGEIVCLGAVLPSTPVKLVLTVRVPLTENRTVALGGSAQVLADGKNDVQDYSVRAASLSPADGDGNGMADAWERVFAGSAGALDPAADLDGDTLSNFEEYLCGTVPTDAASVLKMVSIQPQPDGKTRISWTSVSGRVYLVQRADGAPAAASFKTIKADLAADPSGRNVCVDDADRSQPRFYRVLLQD